MTGACASIRPPPRGGCRPVEGMPVCGVSRADGKGGGGEYCGMPSGKRLHCQAAKGLAGKMALAAMAHRSTPPVAAPATCLLPSGNTLAWPRHPPLGGGRVLAPSLQPAFGFVDNDGHLKFVVIPLRTNYGGGGVRAVAGGTSQAVRRRKRPGSPVPLRTAKGHQSSRRWNCSLWSQEWMARDRK